MRQHKFRVWDKKAKKMYYPTEENDLMLLIGDSGFYQVQNHGNFNMKTAKYKDLCIVDSLDDDLELIQWTGLIDCKGKDIFEGDVVKCHDHPTGVDDTIGSVESKHGHYQVNGHPLHDYGTAWVEVLGNQYNNPELLAF